MSETRDAFIRWDGRVALRLHHRAMPDGDAYIILPLGTKILKADNVVDVVFSPESRAEIEQALIRADSRVQG